MDFTITIPENWQTLSFAEWYKYRVMSPIEIDEDYELLKN